MTPNDKHAILHHYLAALAYRTQKALRGAPPDFAKFEAGHGIRPPQEIVNHMSAVLNHACNCFGDTRDRLDPLPTFEDEITRFHEILEALGAHLAADKDPVEDTPPAGATLEQLLQGPFADAMTHAGQLAMLRRMAGSPVAPESFMAAAIDRTNLTADQPAPRAPLDKPRESRSDEHKGELNMSKTTLTAVHPVLPSRDVAAAVTYYVDNLGFTLLGQDSPDKPRYAVIKRDSVELHLQWHDPAEWAAVERPSLRFVAADLDALFPEYKPRGVFHDKRTIRETPWGTREFAFFDGDKNGLTFYHDLAR